MEFVQPKDIIEKFFSTNHVNVEDIKATKQALENHYNAYYLDYYAKHGKFPSSMDVYVDVGKKLHQNPSLGSSSPTFKREFAGKDKKTVSAEWMNDNILIRQIRDYISTNYSVTETPQTEMLHVLQDFAEHFKLGEVKYWSKTYMPLYKLLSIRYTPTPQGDGDDAKKKYFVNLKRNTAKVANGLPQ